MAQKSVKSHKYEKVKKGQKEVNLKEAAAVIANDPKLKDALQKVNEHAIKQQVEYRNSNLPPDSDYLKPVMERPIHGTVTPTHNYLFLTF